MIALTRESPTVYSFTASDGDVSASLVKSTDAGLYGQGTWMWSVDVFGSPLDTGAAGFRDARASVIAVLETVLPLIP